MSKKRIMNIRPQEVTEGGERSVRYKGSDGKQHPIVAGSGDQPLIVQATLNQGNMSLASEATYEEISQAIDNRRIIIVEIIGMGYSPVVVMKPTPDIPQLILTAIIAMDDVLMQVNILAREGQPTRGTVNMVNSSYDETAFYGYMTEGEAHNIFLSKEEAMQDYVRRTDALAPVNGFSVTILSQQEFSAISQPEQNVIYIIT